MKIASVADVKAHFSAYLRASEQGPVVVTRNGKPAAVLLGVSDEDELERRCWPIRRDFKRSSRLPEGGIEAGAGIRDDEFWKDLEGVKETKKRASKRARPA